MITLITATGGRPEAFALCESMIAKQTYKGPMQWIVVDDCVPPTKCTLKQEYYVGPKQWREGINTHRLNLDHIIPKIQGNYIFIIEDDDYYAPTYIQTHLELLKQAHIVGESKSKYFNIKVPGWKIMPNLKHSSLAQTSFRKSLLPTFEKAVNSGHLYFDVTLWDKAHEQSIPSLLVMDLNLCIGMKGLPGREGITGSHRSRDFTYDSKMEVLKSWIGGAYINYLMLREKEEKWKTATKQMAKPVPKSLVTLNTESQVHPAQNVLKK